MYILIILARVGFELGGYVSGGGSGVYVTTQEFSTKEKCEAARTALVWSAPPSNTSHNLIEDLSAALKTICVAK